MELEMRNPFIIPSDCEKKRGENAFVYLISEYIAIKVPFEYSNESIENDFKIHWELLRGGYSHCIPNLLCSKLGNIKDVYGSVSKGIFMERIHGPNLEELDKTRKSIRKLMKSAEDIAEDIERNLGIAPPTLYGINKRNVIMDERKKRVVLVDFAQWQHIF